MIKENRQMKGMQTTSIMVAFIAVLCCALTSATAANCYHGDECPGEQLCVNLTCETASKPLATCQYPDGCDDWHAVCHDGYCKPGGVYCENESGYCIVGNGWDECCCESGDCSGSSSGDDGGGNPPPPPSDEILFDECIGLILSSCDEESPDPSEFCSDDDLATCESLVRKMNELNDKCDSDDEDKPHETETETDSDPDSDDDDGQSSDPAALPPPPDDPYAPNAWELVECCEELYDPDMAELIECVEGLEADDCEGLMECDEVFDSPPPDEGGSTGDAKDEEDDETNTGSDGQDEDNRDEDDPAEQEQEQPDSTLDDDADQAAPGQTGGTGCQAAPGTTKSSLLIANMLSIII